jgi:arginyl-tRNA synthetase
LIKFGKPLGEKILLRSNGTSVYITQDIYLAKKKFEDYKLNKSIYVVGNEQNYHFEVLFTILEKLGFKQEGLRHLSYGMVELPEGKMKSREGTVVDADDLIYKVQELVKKELSSRAKLSKKQLKERSLKIALASIKYFLLRVDINKNMIFNPKESINFEGDTGPYIQYSYARASSILRKTKKKNMSWKISELHQKEKELIKKIFDFNEIVSKAYLDLNPSLIANYSYKLAQLFNEFYHSCPVLNSENEQFRIKLIEAFRIVLKNSLNLLGIETLEEM